MSVWVSPSNFTSFSSTTDRAGMLMPKAKVSVAKTTLINPRTKASSTHFLERWQHASVMRRHAHAERVSEAVVLESLQITVGESGDVPFNDSGDLELLDAAREPDPGREQLADGGITADAGEDEHDGRQEPSSSNSTMADGPTHGVNEVAGRCHHSGTGVQNHRRRCRS